ncbi:hypothetical protein QWZ03_02795 [Chitinimonas viridis]|uniref:TniQ protein n=1 Tax=Chitinimonas viridis TaxID=664880 RepID=A0ABT8B1F6_9NEIS|nr:hypothetical protein [Chitinimonas viridis]MDN3575697.1 hypothetical protein [Chitinimonas viridis]
MRLHRLPVRPAWHQGESFAGYVLRLHEVNAQPVSGDVVSALRTIYAATDTLVVRALADQLLSTMGVEGYQSALACWLVFRTDPVSGQLIDLRYKPDLACPRCINDFGFRPALWDLRGFDRCPQHVLWLASRQNVGRNVNRLACSIWSRARNQMAEVLAASAAMWLPEGYPVARRTTIPIEGGPAAVYALIAALAFLHQEVRHRRQRIKPVAGIADAIAVAEEHYPEVVGWLSAESGSLVTLLCQEAEMTHTSGSSNRWGWSPFLLRVHQVAGWLLQNKVLTAAHEMLQQLRQIAAEHCLQVDRFTDGHGHAALPVLDNLAIVAPPGCFRRHEDIVGYLQLFARSHGIPALGYGQTGIVVRRQDVAPLADQASAFGRGTTEFYTADRPLWTLN